MLENLGTTQWHAGKRERSLSTAYKLVQIKLDREVVNRSLFASGDDFSSGIVICTLTSFLLCDINSPWLVVG